MKKTAILNLVYTGVFIALGILLPFLSMNNQPLGQILCLMHLPILICGFICGPWYGLAAGLITPLLRTAIVGMPPLYPTALIMALELAAYGCFAGLLHRLLPKKLGYTYLALVAAMLGGRAVYGLAAWGLNTLAGNAFTLETFAAAAFITPWIGIIIQLVVVPPLVYAIQKNQKSNTHAA